MADNDREDAANQVENEENEDTGEQRPPVQKTPESTTSAPAGGDDIIIK